MGRELIAIGMNGKGHVYEAILPIDRRARGCVLLLGSLSICRAEDWVQSKFDSRRSGNVPDRSVSLPLGLVGAVPLTDAIVTAPVVAQGRVFVVDGSGVVFCLDAATAQVLWKCQTRGGKPTATTYRRRRSQAGTFISARRRGRTTS